MKKIIISAIVIAITAIGSYLSTGTYTTRDEKLSDLMMQNIDALSEIEINWGSACMRFYTPWDFTPTEAFWVRLCLPCGETVFATSASSGSTC